VKDNRSAEERLAKVCEFLTSANKRSVVIGKVCRAALREAHSAGNLHDLLGELTYQSVDPSGIVTSELLDRTLSKVIALAAIDFGHQLRTCGVWVHIIEDYCDEVHRGRSRANTLLVDLLLHPPLPLLETPRTA
jgi:hypothetical protein